MKSPPTIALISFCLISILHFGELFAATALVEIVSSKGEGADRSTAIQEALVEAVSKVAGVTLDAASATQLVALETTGKNGKNEFESSESYRSEVKKRSNGLIDKWEIIKDEIVDGRHNIELTVAVVKIVGGGTHATRKTIAVLPLRVVGEPNFIGKVVPSADFGKSLRESLVSLLTSSRKFAVVDETFSEDVVAAASKAEISETAVQSALRQANKLGAQFLITGIAEGVKIFDNPVTVGGNTTKIRRAAGVVRIRVIRVDSGQTVLASEAELESIPDISLFSPQVDQSVARSAARLFSGRILETIYPIRVVSVSDSGEIVIDRGGEGILVGTRLTVFKAGKELVDPATGEKLGREEDRIGDLEVVRVLPKVSYCKLVSEPVEITVDSVCRIAEGKIKKTTVGPKPASSAVDDLFK